MGNPPLQTPKPTSMASGCFCAETMVRTTTLRLLGCFIYAFIYASSIFYFSSLMVSGQQFRASLKKMVTTDSGTSGARR